MGMHLTKSKCARSYDVWITSRKLSVTAFVLPGLAEPKKAQILLLLQWSKVIAIKVQQILREEDCSFITGLRLAGRRRVFFVVDSLILPWRITSRISWRSSSAVLSELIFFGKSLLTQFDFHTRVLEGRRGCENEVMRRCGAEAEEWHDIIRSKTTLKEWDHIDRDLSWRGGGSVGPQSCGVCTVIGGAGSISSRKVVTLPLRLCSCCSVVSERGSKCSVRLSRISRRISADFVGRLLFSTYNNSPSRLQSTLTSQSAPSEQFRVDLSESTDAQGR